MLCLFSYLASDSAISPCHNRHFIYRCSFKATSRTNAHLRDREGKEKTDCSVRKLFRSGRQRQELLCAASELIGACQIEEKTNEQVTG